MSNLLQQAVAISIRAGEEILDVYHNSEFEVETKGDGSPLTLADRRAHKLIEQALRGLTPDTPVLSEESADAVMEARRQWSRFWLVDPLDGTKEFVKRNGEFTVNIALIDNNTPVIGVVHTPVRGHTHFAETGVGAWRADEGASPAAISVRKVNPDDVIMVASRSHAGAEVEQYRTALAGQVNQVDTVSMGSSLKLCLVAEGRADIYPRLGPTSEWDTAAAHCVVTAAGGSVTRLDGQPLVYNKANILNPWFLAGGDPQFDWTRPANGIQEPA